MGGNANLKTAEDSLAYAFGVAMANDIKTSFNFEELNTNALSQGASDIFSESTKISVEEARQFIRGYYQEAQTAMQEEAKKEGDEFLAENADREGITELPSGLQYEVIEEGNGPKPVETDQVKTHYKGTLLDGTEFDSSLGGEPRSFKVNQVIPGWTEALQLMSVGAKWKLYVPPHLAYGERGVPNSPIKPNSTLIFELELLEIVENGGESEE
ncbi:MAG: FKBP-type peptidyl-prolyl cis-trans isomerase [Bacteroidetes bacterium]|nr:FKBP-type peptidyl-prolyl cis-trans isomerase [Bacteroidota bacterium]